MKATTTFRLLISGKLLEALAFCQWPGKEIYLLSIRADKSQGDGGVDVTGAPNSELVEGAGFGQILSFTRTIWALLTKSYLTKRLVAVIIGGSNFGAAGEFSIHLGYPATF